MIRMFRKLLTFDEAQAVIRQKFKPKRLGVERTKLLDASNRVLAENIIATLDIPPFSRSTVDGYAVRAEDTFGADEKNPITLKVCGIVNIGESPKTTVQQGNAAEIVTGAPMPDGSDSVVMVEHTERIDENVSVSTAVAKDENVMKAGVDVKKGETVLKAGQLLGSREIGVLAALGLAKIKVCRVPHVAVLSTGPELTEPGKKLSFGKIYDINAYSLSAAVQESAGTPVYLGVFPDSFSGLQKALKCALASADIVLTSGGVSVGPKDIMPKALGSLGKPGLIICGIAIKPGKPTTVASIDGKPVFSLPGHPTSALLAFHLFARPLIQLMAGRKAERDLEVKALAAMRMIPAKGRRTFIMVKLKQDKSGRLVAEPVPTGVSGAITTLAKADGFVEMLENVQFVDESEEVTVHLFETKAVRNAIASENVCKTW
jgi:putative molybdopterin biosynthesis protein